MTTARLPLVHLFLAAVLGNFCIAGAAAQGPASIVPPSCTAVAQDTCTIARQLGRGINLGNMLEAPQEGDWGVRVDPEYIRITTAAFSNVRVPVRWSNHAAPTADATLDEKFARRVDEVIDALLARGAYVVLDLHHYPQLTGDQLVREHQVDPSVLEIRLVNMWRQIAQRYKNRSPKLLFELLNEPHYRLDAAAWNALAARTLAAVRESNPDRTVLIGPVEWNSVGELKNLTLPPDRHVIVSIHDYSPFEFTHQGVPYLARDYPVGTVCCNERQRLLITQALDVARAWSVKTGYPLYLDEFGSNEKADPESRAEYTRFVRDEAEKRGIPWAYWEFASTFGAWSPEAGAWVEPVRKALLD
jgi:endoglucanase